MEAEISSPRGQAAVVTPAQVRHTKLFDLATTILLSTGALSVSMACHKPGEGLREQVHFNQDEVFFVIEGKYMLTADNQTRLAGPGTVVLIPRNVVHRFDNVGRTTARMLDWSLPDGQGLSLETVGKLADGVVSRDKTTRTSCESGGL
jgi:mannose-6-phosphate isomerase-like protein (cupin superfamily)